MNESENEKAFKSGGRDPEGRVGAFGETDRRQETPIGTNEANARGNTSETATMKQSKEKKGLRNSGRVGAIHETGREQTTMHPVSTTPIYHGLGRSSVHEKKEAVSQSQRQTTLQPVSTPSVYHGLGRSSVNEKKETAPHIHEKKEAVSQSQHQTTRQPVSTPSVYHGLGRSSVHEKKETAHQHYSMAHHDYLQRPCENSSLHSLDPIGDDPSNGGLIDDGDISMEQHPNTQQWGNDQIIGGDIAMEQHPNTQQWGNNQILGGDNVMEQHPNNQHGEEPSGQILDSAAVAGRDDQPSGLNFLENTSFSSDDASDESNFVNDDHDVNDLEANPPMTMEPSTISTSANIDNDEGLVEARPVAEDHLSRLNLMEATPFDLAADERRKAGLRHTRMLQQITLSLGLTFLFLLITLGALVGVFYFGQQEPDTVVVNATAAPLA
eukprot:Sro256_g100670.1 Leucine rich repeat N-terminal domain (438) ;mRNA; f:45905-47401